MVAKKLFQFLFSPKNKKFKKNDNFQIFQTLHKNIYCIQTVYNFSFEAMQSNDNLYKLFSSFSFFLNQQQFYKNFVPLLDFFF